MTENATCGHGKPIDHWCYDCTRDTILLQPCRCESCPDCDGRGFVLGKGWDEFGESMDDRCDFCDGTGTTDTCDRCQELEELEETAR